MNVFKKLSDLLAKIVRVSGYFSATLTLILVLLTVQQVVARHLFNGGSVALQELEWHLFGAIFLFSMAWTYQKDGHVRVDVFYQYFPLRLKALINILGISFFMIPICYFMILYGIDDVLMAWNYINPRTRDYWSKSWFAVDGSFYEISAAIEAWLRSFLLVGEISSDPGGLEARWIARGMLPLGFIILGIQAISSIARELVVLISPELIEERE